MASLSRLVVCLFVAALLRPPAAQAAPQGAPASPELRSLLPAGGQRGTTVRLTITGERLEGAQELLVAGGGLAATAITVVDARTVTADCAIAADCPLGEHAVRLRTAGGVTEMITFHVGALPVIAEAEPNGDVEIAQPVPLDVTVAGVVTREDIDWFSVEAAAGTRLSVEVEGMRLGRSLLDPALVVLDDRRFEVAGCDDSPLLRQDCALSVAVPRDGRYFVGVRDAAFAGSDTGHYRLHIGTFPRPLAATPPAATPGQPVELSWLGSPTPVPPTTLTLPADACGLVPTWAGEGAAVAPSPNWIVASPLPVVTEAEAATRIGMAPIAFHGVLAEPGEEDAWRVSVGKGVPVVLRVYARRLRSPLDPVISVRDASGKVIGELDDTVGADPELRATPDQDATFELRIRDHRRRGGPTFVYRIELVFPTPSLTVGLERIDPRRPQLLQSIAIPRGQRMAALLRVERVEVGGEVVVDAPALPAGVTLRTLPVPADQSVVPAIFESAPESPLGGGLYELRARAGDVHGAFRQTMPLVIGPPNDTVYQESTVDRLAIAVTEPAPFRVRLLAPAAPILRSGAKELAVEVERDAGFTGDVVVHMLWNPPGISSAGSLAIPAAATRGAYQLNAAADAQAATWKLAVLAHAAVGGGDRWIASDFVDLAVAPEHARGALRLAATTQGTRAAVVCGLESVRPFDGDATLTLLGLPPKTRCAPRVVHSGDTEVVFDVEVDADAPVGQHRGLLCELSRTEQGEPVTQRLAFDGVLRIDAPPPPDAQAANAPPPPPPPPEQPASRPLTRLEQLRQEARERQAREGQRP